MKIKIISAVWLSFTVCLFVCCSKQIQQNAPGPRIVKVTDSYVSQSPGREGALATIAYVQIKGMQESGAEFIINRYLGPESFIDIPPEKIAQEFASGAYPFDEVSVRSLYFTGDIISVAYDITTSGAYTSKRIYALTVNTKAEILDLETIIGTQALEKVGLRAETELKQILDRRIGELKRLDLDENIRTTAIDTLKQVGIDYNTQSFYLAEGEIIFIIDYLLPHALEALAPENKVIAILYNVR